MLGKSLSWLLEHESPDVRSLALRHLADLPPGDPALLEAARLAHSRGPVAAGQPLPVTGCAPLRPEASTAPVASACKTCANGLFQPRPDPLAPPLPGGQSSPAATGGE